MFFCALLLLWYGLDLTGLAIGGQQIVVSVFASEGSEMQDVWFMIVYLAVLLAFIFKDRLGTRLLGMFLLGWSVLQGSMYFSSPEGIARYNRFFKGTYHIIAPSESDLVKDLYHIVLDVLIALPLLCFLVYCVTGRRQERRRWRAMRHR